MARMSAFGPRRAFISTSSTPLTEENYFNLAGLNLYSPDELMSDTESPYARNFRIFKDDALTSRVCVSKRDGHDFYSVPVGETDRGAITSTTGAADKAVYSIYQYAQKFTVSAAGRLTKLTINVKNDNSGTAPLLVDIYSNNSGAPGTKLASSSISQSDIAATYGYVTVRFIEAPEVETSTDYWFVVHQQSEGTGDYKLSSNTSATTALYSSDGGNTWAATTFALNYHAYVSTNAPVLGFTRYYRSTDNPITLLVAGDTLYSVNDSTGALTTISATLDASATRYSWVNALDKIYFVNGVDTPKVYDGSTLADLGGSPGVSIDIALHKGRMWLLKSDGKVIFSEDGDFETYGATSFLYTPSPKNADNALRIIPYQDNLVVMKRNSKFIISGSDISTITLRESTAVTGLVGADAVWKEGNYIYFLSKDSVCIFNGGTDSDTSIKVDRILDNSANLDTAKLIVHDGKIRIYYAPSGSGYLKNVLIYDTSYKQWMMDDEVFVGFVGVFNSQNDANILVEASSLIGDLYYGESGTSDLGKPILFDYWTKYFSFKHPSRKHRIKRLYPYFNAGDGPYYITVGIDADEADSPTETQVYLGTTGATWGGSSTWGGGSVWGGGTLEPTRISVPGQARKHQIRFSQHGVDNPVEILGYSIYTITRKPI